MLIQLMESKRDELIAKLGRKIDHGPSKGDDSEIHWLDFFESFLPSKYKVTSGFVIDSKGGISEQIDLIIYDALYAPVMFTINNRQYVAVESVYAIFECKQKINKTNLEYANNKIESVINLERSKRSIINAGVPLAPRELTPILGGILAREAIAKKTLEDHLKSNRNINLGCAIESTTFIVNENKGGVNVNFSDKEETIISFFYIILDELYKIGTVSGMDIREYANVSLESIKIVED